MAKTQTQREDQIPLFKESKAFSGFSVNDVGQAKKFYGDTLGLDVDDQNGMLFLNIKGGNRVLIYPKDDHKPASFTILNFPVDDINAAVDGLTTHGIKLERYDVPGLEPNEKLIYSGQGPTIAWFKDPAGNILSVLEEPDTGRG